MTSARDLNDEKEDECNLKDECDCKLEEENDRT